MGWRNLKIVAAVFVLFAVLYVSTCQRGPSWQDSGCFQHQLLHASFPVGEADNLSCSHPLYLMMTSLLIGFPECSAPNAFFLCNASSGIWMALALAMFCVCALEITGSVKASLLASCALGLSHMVWWLATITETYALECLILMIECWLVIKLSKDERKRWAFLLAFANGVHFSISNTALLVLPALALFALCKLRRDFMKACAICAGFWLVGSSAVFINMWLTSLANPQLTLYSLCKSQLVGKYGGAVGGIMPPQMKVTAVNYALAALSFWFPLLVCVLKRKSVSEVPPAIKWMLGICALFVARYFVIDQAFFILPTLFLLMLAVAPRLCEVRNYAMMMTLVVLAAVAVPFAALALAPSGMDRPYHPGRNDARYFLLPWKFNENSCKQYLESCSAVDAEAFCKWRGYLE